jgi:hypothetical protein
VDIQSWEHVDELIKVWFHPITNFELANQYKGIEDPREHIYFFE